MLVTQVPIYLHGQRSAVFMPSQSDGGNIDAGVDTPGRKEMAQIVVV